MATTTSEPVEDRVARLESDVAHIRSDIGEIKLDIRELRAALGGLRDEMHKRDSSLRDEMHELDSSLRDAVAKVREEIIRSSRGDRPRMYVFAGVILSVMARGFHWI